MTMVSLPMILLAKPAAEKIGVEFNINKTKLAHSIKKSGLDLVLLCICFLSPLSYAQLSIDDFTALDEQYKSLSNTIYSHLASTQASNLEANNTSRLATQVQQLTKKNQSAEAIVAILNHLDLIKDDIDSEHTGFFVEILLKHNEARTAEALYEHAKNEAAFYTLASIEFLFAKYLFDRQQWNASLNLFYQASQNNVLADHQTHYALLTIGILLQSNKRHREALKYYESIPRNSKHYHLAQLNAAIVNIRQGWWTDAHLIIQNLLREDMVKQNESLTDRLHVILGYSMLRNEFYRDSREAFRNVRLEGEYANRALIGLGLSAANQGDFVGALNAIDILKNKKTLDLYVEESHLLLPYIYENLKQDITASAGYTSAIDYYQQRIASLNTIKASSNEQLIRLIPRDGLSQVALDNHVIDYAEYYPMYIFENITQLNRLSKKIVNRDMRIQIDTLQQQYYATFATMTKEVVDQQIYYLNSYLNQSRYGLAKLYDEKE